MELYKHYPYSTLFTKEGDREPPALPPTIRAEAERIKYLPIMHLNVSTKGLSRDWILKLQTAIRNLHHVYSNKYHIVVAPADIVQISTSDNNVVRIDLHDEETVKNFCKIMHEESWRIRKEESNDSSESNNNMAGSE